MTSDGRSCQHTHETVLCLSRVFHGSTDAAVFEDFIQQLLKHCGKWPEQNSVIVMDNASFHHSDRIKGMCADAGVKLLYLPPYSPDLYPKEEFFSELKACIRRYWQKYEQTRIVSGTSSQHSGTPPPST
jgi:transposase